MKTKSDFKEKIFFNQEAVILCTIVMTILVGGCSLLGSVSNSETGKYSSLNYEEVKQKLNMPLISIDTAKEVKKDEIPEYAKAANLYVLNEYEHHTNSEKSINTYISTHSTIEESKKYAKNAAQYEFDKYIENVSKDKTFNKSDYKIDQIKTGALLDTIETSRGIEIKHYAPKEEFKEGVLEGKELINIIKCMEGLCIKLEPKMKYKISEYNRGREAFGYDYFEESGARQTTFEYVFQSYAKKMLEDFYEPDES